MKFDRVKDFVGIIAPASKCADTDLKLKELEKLLESKGFRCKVSEKIFDDENLPFVAASRQNRVNGLKGMLADPEVKIILTFRGGYGCTEIMLDCISLQATGEKTLIGYSDITAFHVLFNQKYKLSTIHGFPATNIKSLEVLSQITDILEGQPINLKLKTINKPASSVPKITGKVTGGNLTIFCNMIGTPLSPRTKNKILILEDVHEKGYHVHRHLVHLKNAGLFKGVKAVIFGDFTNSDEHIDVAVKDFCLSHIQNIPTFKTEGIGHGEVNHPFILGSKASIIGEDFFQKSIFKLS